MAHQVFRRPWLAIREAGSDERALVASGSRASDSRAISEQDVHDILLHAGGCGRRTRGDKAECSPSTTVDLGLRIDLDASLHKDAVQHTEAYVTMGKAPHRKYYIPQTWEANLRRLRRTDPDLFEYLDWRPVLFGFVTPQA